MISFLKDLPPKKEDVKLLVAEEYFQLSNEDKKSLPHLSKHIIVNNKIVKSKKICRKRNPSCLSDHKAARLKKPRKPKRKKRGD